MQDVRKMRKKARKKDKHLSLSKVEKKGVISRKKRMRNSIFIVFLVTTLLIRKDWMDSICEPVSGLHIWHMHNIL